MNTTGKIEGAAPVLKGRVANPVSELDDTLTKGGYCADAKAVGDALKNHMMIIESLKTEIESLKGERI